MINKFLIALTLIALTCSPCLGSFVIPNGSVTTAKIANGAVTPAKKAALGQQVSGSSGAWLGYYSSYTDVPNLSVTITTTGRPVFVALIPASSAAGSEMSVGVYSGASTSLSSAFLRVLRDGSDINAAWGIRSSGVAYDHANTGASFVYIDVNAGAGSHTYKIQATGDGASQVEVTYAKLVAFEL